jgi:hypothetical protein
MEKKEFKATPVEKTPNLPEKKFIAGPISATIWKNNSKDEGGEDHSFQTVSLARVFKNKEGEWQNTGTLRINDLPKAAIVLNKAYEYLTVKETNVY